jgi:hypothetical protein
MLTIVSGRFKIQHESSHDWSASPPEPVPRFQWIGYTLELDKSLQRGDFLLGNCRQSVTTARGILVNSANFDAVVVTPLVQPIDDTRVARLNESGILFRGV